MGRSRVLLCAAATVAVTLGALAAPAAAASPRLALVNGIPGRAVDVCVGNTEVRSNLGYGRWVQRTVSAGDPIIRFRAASPGTCAGEILASRAMAITDDDDLTLVATRKAPQKVVVFDNLLPPAPIGEDICGVAVRDAADVGKVVLMAAFVGMPIEPTSVSSFGKGDEFRTDSEDVSADVVASKPNQLRPFARSGVANCFTGTRVEWILVGSTTRNARFAIVSRPTLPK